MAKAKVGRKKLWFTIVAPKVFNEVEVGETSAYDPESIIGRKVWVYYSQLSGDVTKHYIKVQLLINSVKGEKAFTEICGYEITRPYLARAIRRRKSKVEVIKDVNIKDKKLRIKLVILTSYKVNARQRTELRHKAEEIMERETKDKNIDSIVMDIINKKLQNAIYSETKKIAPIAFVEVRKIEVE